MVKTIMFKRSGGMSLIEVLMVMAIIAVLAGLLLPVLLRTERRGLDARARNDVSQLSIALRMYADDWGVFPPDDDGDESCVSLMRALQGGAYGEWNVADGESLLDPWDRPYVYVYPAAEGTEAGVLFNIYSKGSDGVEGTEHDIKNW